LEVTDFEVNGNGKSPVSTQCIRQGFSALSEQHYLKLHRAGELGFFSGRTVGYLTQPHKPLQILTGGGHDLVAGMFIFAERIAWEPESDVDMPVWTNHCLRFKLTITGLDGKERYIDWGDEKVDGPSTNGFSRSEMWAFAVDAPRKSFEYNPRALPEKVCFSGTWLCTVRDSVSAWAAKIHIEFEYWLNKPTIGHGQFMILVPPHRLAVNKLKELVEEEWSSRDDPENLVNIDQSLETEEE
jgi:hypothetical protein